MKISKEIKDKIVVKTWIACVIASIMSLLLKEVGSCLFFVWVSLCICCGSFAWFEWWVDLTAKIKKD